MNTISTAAAPCGIAEDQFRRARRWFLGYAREKVASRPDCRWHLAIKIKHSIRVAKEIGELAQRLYLDEKQVWFARLIGILHDVGRFQQYADYGTYIDRLSVDHGELGARVAEACGVLKRIDPHCRRIVLAAIRYHNRARIPDEASGPCRFYARLVRDADKLDIYRVILTEGAGPGKRGDPVIEEHLPASDTVSEKVAAALRRQRIVASGDVANRTDLMLLRMGWVFDVNFTPTLVEIRNRGLIDAMRQRLVKTPEIEDLCDRIQAYVITRTAAEAG